MKLNQSFKHPMEICDGSLNQLPVNVELLKDHEKYTPEN